jgi:hypothetical protein
MKDPLPPLLASSERDPEGGRRDGAVRGSFSSLGQTAAGEERH